MRRSDVLGIIGLLLLVCGLGGGVELTLMAQTHVYEFLAAAGGNANPRDAALELSRSLSYAEIGIPLAMLGVVLLAISVRGLIVEHRSSAESAA